MNSRHIFGELRLSPDIVRMLSAEAREHPRWADVQNRAGLMALARGDLEAALERFEVALEINPRYAWAGINRALTLGLSGKGPEAAAALAEAQEPERGVLTYAAAALALFAGDAAAGEAALHPLAADQATRPDVRRLQAALMRLRAPQEAEAAWNRMRHHFASLPADWSQPWDGERCSSPSFVPGLHQLYLEGSSLEGRLGRWEAAESMASLARLHWADEAVYLNQRGFLATLAGRDEKACKLHEEAARIAPDEPRAHIALAYLWSASGDLERAYRALVNALARAPRYADLLYQMGLLHLARDGAKEALASFRGALEINPDYIMARLQEAEVLFGLQRWTEARVSYDRVLASGLESWEIRLNHAQTLVRVGDLEAALDACGEARRLAPREPRVLYHLGRIHRLRGEQEKAWEAWGEFLKLDGEPDCRAEVEQALNAKPEDPS